MKPRNKYSERLIVEAPHGVSRTQQHFKDEVDINRIMAKYRKTGVIQHVTRARQVYGEFDTTSNMAEQFQTVAKAQQQFDMLPAEIRNKFKNSIPGFFAYIADPANREDCIAMGIFEKPPAPPSPPPSPDPKTETD